MKIAISQELLVYAIERGGMAALSDEAFSDNSNVAPLIQSVKISATEKNIVFESTTNVLSSKYVLEVDSNNGVDVKEPGTVLVKAKPLNQWLKTQKKSTIGLSLKTLDTPKMIGISDDVEQDGNSIQMIGSLNLVSKDDKGNGDKWKLDCYDESQVTMVDFDGQDDVHVSVPVSEMEAATKLTKISLLPKDWNHIYDSFVMEKVDDDILLAATDFTRCSTYALQSTDRVDDKFFENSRVFLNGAYFISILKFASSTDLVNIYFDIDNNKSYVYFNNFFVRISSPDDQQRNKFPQIKSLVKTKYYKVGALDKDSLQKRINAASIVNSDSIQFIFEENNNKVKIVAISEAGKAPTSGLTVIEDCASSFKAVFSVKHLNEFMKNLGSDKLTIKTMDSKDIFVFEDEAQENSRMYTMKKNSSIYA